MGGGTPNIPKAPQAAPPVTESRKEVQQASSDVAQQELMKRSIRKTIHAGDTGGYKGAQAFAAGNPAAGAGGSVAQQGAAKV